MAITTIKTTIRNRIDTEANWTNFNPILADGEIAISGDKNGMFKVGDGTTAWSDLSYSTANTAISATSAGYATNALADAQGNTISSTYISNVTLNGKTLSVTKNGITETFTTVDEDTTYDDFVGATSVTPGESGLVPAPGSGDQNKFLKADGTWEVPSVAGQIKVFTGATSSTDGSDGLVPKPTTGNQDKFLKADGSWDTPENTTYNTMSGATSISNGIGGLVPTPTASVKDKYLSNRGTWDEISLDEMTGASASANGKKGLVPAPSAGDQHKFLRADGEWIVPTNTTYSTGTSSNLGLTKLYSEDGTATDGTLTQSALHDALAGKSSTTHKHVAEDILSGTLSSTVLPDSGVSAGTFTKVTVDAKGRVTSATSPTTLAGYGITDAAASSHTHSSNDITSLDASKLTGTIDIDRLPHGALERCIVVTDDDARFELTTDDVQLGDTVKVNDTGLMYFVVDEDELDNDNGYESFSATTAAAVEWSNVNNKPTVFTPDSHVHSTSDITGLDTALASFADVDHTHDISDITSLSSVLDGKASSVHTHEVSDIEDLNCISGISVDVDGGTVTVNSTSAEDTIKLISGSNVTITPNASNKTITISSVDTNTHYASKTVVSSTNSGIADTTSAIANGNVYLNHVEEGSVKSSHKITGSGLVSVTADNTGNINIDASIVCATGVKGDKESTYRTGNVNITPANIGALPTSGGTLTGNISIQGSTSNTNVYGSTNPTLEFKNEEGDQNLSLIFTDYNEIATPSSLTLIGNTGGEYLIVPNLKVNGTIYEGGVALSSKYQAAGNYADGDADGQALSAVKLSTARSINGARFDGSASVSNFGTTSTAASTSVKVVSCAGFMLTTGAVISVKFTNGHTASGMSLNVNNTGAKTVYYNGAALDLQIGSDIVVDFRYDGTNWIIVGDYSSKNDVAVTQTVSSATNAQYRVLLSNSANDTTETAGVRKDTDLRYNPYDNTLSVSHINTSIISTTYNSTNDSYLDVVDFGDEG